MTIFANGLFYEDVSSALATLDAMLFKGVIDASTNPNYPAADAGYVYKISVAGKIGGASGTDVVAGDTAYCITDGSAAGDQATVGANWVIVENNITNGIENLTAAEVTQLANIDATTISTIQWGYLGAMDQGVAIADTPTFGGITLGATTAVTGILDEDTMASNSATDLATQQSIKAYVDSLVTQNTQQIRVIDGAATIPGKVYPTINAAFAYTGTQTPSETNRFAVMVSGVNSESETCQQWVFVVGDGMGLTRLTGTWTAAPISAGEPLLNAFELLTFEGTWIGAGTDYSQFYFCEIKGGSGNAGTTGIVNMVSCYAKGGDWTNIATLILSDCISSEGAGETLIFPTNVQFASGQVQGCIGSFSGGIFNRVHFTQQCTSSTLTGGNFVMDGCTFDATGFVIADGETWTMTGCVGRSGNTSITIDADGGSGGGTLNSEGCTAFAVTNNNLAANYANTGTLFDPTATWLTSTETQGAIDELASMWDGSAAGQIRQTTQTDNVIFGSQAKLSSGNELTPDVDPGGLGLQQNTYTGNILSFKNINVARAMTTGMEADTFGQFHQVVNTEGGLWIEGASETDIGLLLSGYGDTVDTTTGTSAQASVMVLAGKNNAGSLATLAATENVWAAANYPLSVLALLKGSGKFYLTSDGMYVNTVSANASAILQADSTTQGFLEPRMTEAQRDAISTPAAGLQAYNSDDNLLNYYDGTDWDNIDASREDYAFAYDTGTQTVSVANTFQSLNLGTNAQLSGWTHSTGTGTFGCTQTGLYLVQYSVGAEKTAGLPGVLEVRATFNGTEVPGSQAASDVISLNVVNWVSHSFIVSATSGQDLVLQFTGPATTYQVASGGGNATTDTSASVTIIRIT